MKPYIVGQVRVTRQFDRFQIDSSPGLCPDCMEELSGGVSAIARASCAVEGIPGSSFWIIIFKRLSVRKQCQIEDLANAQIEFCHGGHEGHFDDPI